MEPKDSPGTGEPNTGTEVKEGETGELVVDDPTLPEAPAIEESYAKPIAASWGGIKVIFRGRRIEVFDAGAPTIAAIEGVIRLGLEQTYGDDFEVSVSGAERTDK